MQMSSFIYSPSLQRLNPPKNAPSLLFQRPSSPSFPSGSFPGENHLCFSFALLNLRFPPGSLWCCVFFRKLIHIPWAIPAVPQLLPGVSIHTVLPSTNSFQVLGQCVLHMAQIGAFHTDITFAYGESSFPQQKTPQHPFQCHLGRITGAAE